MKQLILALIFGTVILLNGCDSKSENTKDSGENKSETSSENKNEQNSGSSVTQLTTEGEANTDPSITEESKESQLEMEPGLPADFPKDIPQHDKVKLLGSLNSSDGMMVTYESTDKVQNIIDFYKDEMSKSGYKIEEGGEVITPGKGGLINWIKNDKSVQIVLGYDQEKGLTSFVITYK